MLSPDPPAAPSSRLVDRLSEAERSSFVGRRAEVETFRQALLSPVPPFAVMEVLAEANRRRAAGEAVISLCAGQPTDGAPVAVREAARVR